MHRLAFAFVVLLACHSSTPAPPTIDAAGGSGSGDGMHCAQQTWLQCEDADHLARWYCGAEAPGLVCTCANGCVEANGSAYCAAGSAGSAGSGSCF